MSTALVFNIQKFCINDGPGIRTTVFFKGCPLNCLWCHNPESKRTEPEISFIAEKCIGCRRCVAPCPNGCHTFTEDGTHIFDRTNCIHCGKCTEVGCPALSLVGKPETVESILKAVRKDSIFYQKSGGGMTLSGGEPMMQYPFVLELLKAAHDEGIHTAIETCGFAPAAHYEEIASYVDVFLFDYKETSSELHKEFTGVPNETIISNLELLDRLGAHVILRCPIIPSLNDREDHFKGIADIANRLSCIKQIDVEPYHPLGISKCERIGISYPLDLADFTNDDAVSMWIEKIQSQTEVPVKKG